MSMKRSNEVMSSKYGLSRKEYNRLMRAYDTNHSNVSGSGSKKRKSSGNSYKSGLSRSEFNSDMAGIIKKGKSKTQAYNEMKILAEAKRKGMSFVR